MVGPFRCFLLGILLSNLVPCLDRKLEIFPFDHDLIAHLVVMFSVGEHDIRGYLDIVLLLRLVVLVVLLHPLIVEQLLGVVQDQSVISE